jgi:hypothetical protein
MDPWANIEISTDDPEIGRIDQIQGSIGTIPQNVIQIRELITGFEICHFKFQQHLKYLKEAISKLETGLRLEKIGANHIRNGEDAWRKDTTGRSRLGQEYIRALKKWLGEDPGETGGEGNQQPGQQVSRWLGKPEPEKERLVRLLIARMLWDWKSYEKYKTGKDNSELEYQVCRMDICHYDFPGNLVRVIKAIGRLEPADGFEGCGSHNAQIRTVAGQEFLGLNDLLKSIFTAPHPSKDDLMKAWLTACLAKTIKEQVKLKDQIHHSP